MGTGRIYNWVIQGTEAGGWLRKDDGARLLISFLLRHRRFKSGTPHLGASGAVESLTVALVRLPREAPTTP